jgi:hypothetical protein
MDVSGGPGVRQTVNWAAAHPGASVALVIVLYAGAGAFAAWWVSSRVLASHSGSWAAWAAAGALCAVAASLHWAYVVLVKGYQVGAVNRGLAYVYTYAGAVAGVFALVTRDSVSVLTIFAAALCGVFFLCGMPLTIAGRMRYLKDPQAALRMMQQASWARGLRVQAREGPPTDAP